MGREALYYPRRQSIDVRVRVLHALHQGIVYLGDGVLAELRRQTGAWGRKGSFENIAHQTLCYFLVHPACLFFLNLLVHELQYEHFLERLAPLELENHG